MDTIIWHGCYREGWKSIIVPEAFSHPAKYSRSLIQRIYRFAIEQGYIRAGDTVLDPFGGIACGAFDALRLGLHWIGCELEPRFVELANQNISKWNADYAGKFKQWGSARIIQGDSRKLLEVIQSADCCMSSPPFADKLAGEPRKDNSILAQMQRGENKTNGGAFGKSLSQVYGQTSGNLGNLHATEQEFAAVISSPPYVNSIHDGNGIDPDKLTGNIAGKNSQAFAEGYGCDPRQLGAMPGGSFDSVISSPPYTGNEKSDYLLSPDGKTRRRDLKRNYKQGYGCFRGSETYGQSPGQLGAMPGGSFDATVSSPPWEQSGDASRTCNENGTKARQATSERGKYERKYGITEGQIGEQVGENFWTAAREIVTQTYLALKKNSVSIWVCKDFVRNKNIVPFCAQWRQLCESVGFKPLHEIHAMLVQDYGTQNNLDGGETKHRREKKSFFRRLAEKKGSPRIDYEVVLFMRK